MTAGHKWTHEESGALAYSQCAGNINVPELALSRLVEERNDLKAKLAESHPNSDYFDLVDQLKTTAAKLTQVEADAADLRKSLEIIAGIREPRESQDFARGILDSTSAGQRLLDELAESKARCQDMIRERDDLLTQLGAWHSQFQTSQLSHAVAERDTLRATAQRLESVLRKHGIEIPTE